MVTGSARVGRIDDTPRRPAASRGATRDWRPRRRSCSRLSIVARLGVTYLVPNGTNFVDLHVYVDGAATIGTTGALYDYVYADQTPDFPLPFTYPPFAAVVFYPLHLLPFGVVALALAVRHRRRALRRGAASACGCWAPTRTGAIGASRWCGRRVGIWIEPLRSTFDSARSTCCWCSPCCTRCTARRWWVSGLLVGLAAGVKLTPAVSGLYFLGARRWGAVVFSAVVFFATVGVSRLVVGDQARYYFTDLLGDASRVGPIGHVVQPVAGAAASRASSATTPVTGLPCWSALAVTAVLAFLALAGASAPTTGSARSSWC